MSTEASPIDITLVPHDDRIRICLACAVEPDCNMYAPACGLVAEQRRLMAAKDRERQKKKGRRQPRPRSVQALSQAERFRKRVWRRNKLRRQLKEEGVSLENALAGRSWRTCSLCREPWPLTTEFFHLNPGKKIGFQHRCKNCRCLLSARYAERRRRERGVPARIPKEEKRRGRKMMRIINRGNWFTKIRQHPGRRRKMEDDHA